MMHMQCCRSAVAGHASPKAPHGSLHARVKFSAWSAAPGWCSAKMKASCVQLWALAARGAAAASAISAARSGAARAKARGVPRGMANFPPPLAASSTHTAAAGEVPRRGVYAPPGGTSRCLAVAHCGAAGARNFILPIGDDMGDTDAKQQQQHTAEGAARERAHTRCRHKRGAGTVRASQNALVGLLQGQAQEPAPVDEEAEKRRKAT